MPGSTGFLNNRIFNWKRLPVLSSLFYYTSDSFFVLHFATCKMLCKMKNEVRN